MNIKGVIATLMLAVLASTYSSAQDSPRAYSEEDCAKYRSLYYQYLKQGAYRDATYFWTLAYDYCGGIDSLDGKFFSNARVGYSQLLSDEEKKDSPDPVLVKNYRDTLYWIYEQRMLIEDDPDWTADYASMLVSDKDPRHGKIDTLWANSIHRLKDKASYIQIKQYFRHLIINNFNDAAQEDKDKVRTFVINEYLILSEYCKTAIKNAEGNEKTISKYENAQDFLDKYFEKIVDDCAVLCRVLDTKLYDLPANKEEKIAEINKYLDLMDRKKCSSDTTYGKYVDMLIITDPSASAYYFGGKNALENGKESKAAEYFEKAVEMEGTGENADKYKLALADAQYRTHNYKSAFKTAKSIGDGEYKGKAMVICGNAIAATANSCGESTFERKANYWLANDYYQKAASLGEEVSSGKFLNNAPTKEDCFNENISDGASYTLSCWGESTTVRPQ